MLNPMRFVTQLALVLLVVGAQAPSVAQAPTAESRVCDVGRAQGPVVGQDLGAVLRVEAGWLWLFGDTWLGSEDGSTRTIRGHASSTAAVQTGSDPCGPVRYMTDPDGGVRQAIPLRPSDDPARFAHWPVAAISLSSEVYVYFLRVRKGIDPTDERSPFNFEVLGAGLARASVGTLEFELVHEGALFFDGREMPSAAVVHGDFVYHLGCPPAEELRRPCFLSRVAVSDIERVDAYHYWTGASFSREIERAVPVIDTAAPRVSVLSREGTFFVVYSPPFSCKVKRRWATSLVGPWSEEQLIAELSAPEGAFCYGATLVSVDAEGRATLAWNTNGPLALHSSNANLYWTHLTRAEWTPTEEMQR